MYSRSSFWNKFLITSTIILSSNYSLVQASSCQTTVNLKDLNTIPEYKYTYTDIKSNKTRPGKTLKINPKLTSKWHEPSGDIKSITILIHGLNYRTDYMEDIVAVLKNAGSKVLNVSLPGYREVVDQNTGIPHKDFELKPVKFAGFNFGHKIVDRLDSHPERSHSLEYFHSHIMKAYCIAKNEAEFHGATINFSAFSMGGAIVTSLLNNPQYKRELDISKMILIAPGIMTSGYVTAGSFLSNIIPNARFSSGSGKHIYEKTSKVKQLAPPIQANQMLMEFGYENANIPTIVFVSKSDGILAHDKMDELAATDLTNWSIIPVDNSQGNHNGYHHIITLKSFVGDLGWNKVQSQVTDFLNN